MSVKARICDRCGKFYESYYEKNPKYTDKGGVMNGLAAVHIHEDGTYRTGKPKNLCPDCMKEFLFFVESGQKEEKQDIKEGEYCIRELTGVEARKIIERLFSDSTEKEYPFTEVFAEAIGVAIQALEEIQQYRAIGTVEECQEAKKPLEATECQKKAGYKHRCPECNCAVGYMEKKPFRKKVLIEHAAPYCCICGQELDWSDSND